MLHYEIVYIYSLYFILFRITIFHLVNIFLLNFIQITYLDIYIYIYIFIYSLFLTIYKCICVLYILYLYYLKLEYLIFLNCFVEFHSN